MSEQLDHVTLGFDIGGTNLRAAAVTADGTIVERMQLKSYGTERSMEDSIVHMSMDFIERYHVLGIGIAVAGFLTAGRERVRFAPHLPWRDAPLQERLAARLPVPVALEHDANSAAIAEAAYGAARDAETWVLVSVGTGIGAALVHRGEIYRGAFGTAPELGHLPVVPDGRECPCGKRGCLERYCSGTALAATAIELSAQHGSSDQAWTGESVIAAARTEDPIALAAMADFTHWLGVTLAMTSDIFDPELIVLGGGVSADGDVFLPTAVEKAQREIVGAGHRPFPEVKLAQLGNDAGIIGAARMARIAADTGRTMGKAGTAQGKVGKVQ
ncbi:ROK family protein [Corynebacterium sp. H128]|uniref:ROK family protein n=1 Tax=unclassified Corynebacterium TaxID=2624378 RepID=UPI00309AA2AB